MLLHRRTCGVVLGGKGGGHRECFHLFSRVNYGVACGKLDELKSAVVGPSAARETVDNSLSMLSEGLLFFQSMERSER